MTTTDTAPNILCNAYGTPYKFQTLAQWQAYINTCNSAGALNGAWKTYKDGAYGHNNGICWHDNTPENDKARIAIFSRAKTLGIKYSKVIHKFIDPNN